MQSRCWTIQKVCIEAQDIHIYVIQEGISIECQMPAFQSVEGVGVDQNRALKYLWC